MVKLLERKHLDHLFLFRWRETSLKDTGNTVEILTPWARVGKLILEYVSLEEMAQLASLAELYRQASDPDLSSPWPVHQVEAFIAQQADSTVLPRALGRLRDM